MAEGWARVLCADVIEPFSAGIEAHGLNPMAVRVMAEAGVDISRNRSQHLSEFSGIEFDYVVTVCDDARESCPVFCGPAKTIHRSFDDPPALARSAPDEESALDIYRRVCHEIRELVESLPGLLERNQVE